MAKKKEAKESNPTGLTQSPMNSKKENVIPAGSTVTTDDVKAEEDIPQTPYYSHEEIGKFPTDIKVMKDGVETDVTVNSEEELMDNLFEKKQELKEPEFHDQESDVQGNKRPHYHRQDIVNIAHVVYEAFGAYNRANGRLSPTNWDNEQDDIKQGLIESVEDVIHGIPFVSDDAKSQVLFNAIVNALK